MTGDNLTALSNRGGMGMYGYLLLAVRSMAPR